jgi:hypothetical protein
MVYTDEELLEALKQWAKEHGKSPTERDVKLDKSLPSFRTYIYRFGSFNNAKKLVGLKVNEPRRKLKNLDPLIKRWETGRLGELSENAITNYKSDLKQLQDFLNREGKTMREMTFEDIEKYVLEIEDKYSKGTLKHRFNAIKNFLKFFIESRF